MGCKYHIEVDVVYSCEACHSLVCEKCVTLLDNHHYCHQCYWEMINVQVDGPITWISRPQTEWLIGLFGGIVIQFGILLFIDEMASFSIYQDEIEFCEVFIGFYQWIYFLPIWYGLKKTKYAGVARGLRFVMVGTLVVTILILMFFAWSMYQFTHHSPSFVH